MWELYALTHEAEIKETENQIIAYVAEKTGFSEDNVRLVYDKAGFVLMAGSLVRGGIKATVKASAKVGANALKKSLKEEVKVQPKAEVKADQGVKKGVKTESNENGEYRGGAYGKLDTKTGFERHHMPANSISPIHRNRGPAIQMEVADHALTSSFKNSKKSQQYRGEVENLINKGKFRDAMAKEIKDVKNATGPKYNKAMEEMLDYSKKQGLLDKKKD